jgi:DNA-binding response OmpR family regulator
MFKLGFDICALAPSARKARSLAMNDQPDVALVDVCLEGGREGIEIARWLKEVCGVPIVFVTAYGACAFKAGLSSSTRRCNRDCD